MRYVYWLESLGTPGKKYIGLTDDIENRLQEHNQGKSIYTNKHKPWKLVGYIAFANRDKAFLFERYLKHGSGHAFAKRHFWD